MPSRQINEFSQKGNRKKIELVARPGMEQHLDTIVGEVNGLIARAKVLTENDVWPRRPLALTEKPTSTSSTLKVPKGEAQTVIKDDASVS